MFLNEVKGAKPKLYWAWRSTGDTHWGDFVSCVHKTMFPQLCVSHRRPGVCTLSKMLKMKDEMFLFSGVCINMLKTQINDRKAKNKKRKKILTYCQIGGGSTLTGLLDFHFITFNELLQLFTRVFLFLFLLWRLSKARILPVLPSLMVSRFRRTVGVAREYKWPIRRGGWAWFNCHLLRGEKGAATQWMRFGSRYRPFALFPPSARQVFPLTFGERAWRVKCPASTGSRSSSEGSLL